MRNAQLALPGVAEGPIEWVWADDGEEVVILEHFVHATVMRDEVVAALAPRSGETYLDVTLGAGGHAEAILEAAAGVRVVGIDRDAMAIRAAASRLARFGDRVTLVHARFSELESVLGRLGIGRVDGLCADLGVSSPQLDEAARGMSFRREGPIDMRMDRETGETALDIIQRMGDDALADIIYRYGDERRSRRIARSIRRALMAGELKNTLDLRRAIVRAVGPVRVGGVDPATRTFQALRIAVNGELDELAALLAALPRVIAPGGAAAIITFHSLEDRQVKHAFLDKSTWTLLWKKPLGASEEERAHNLRSRSAKLRAVRRTTQVEG
jgi:16S rRNA (cytosine1402-N4)-methyltransferase